ncbi:hypothetical protein [Sediminibacterium ginsengisoli]|uniref:Tetratricopeptide repeat-containing protein n=1 Tax=Sediminibacterium ginsengisoli TaxID=413434 RepID=A0A1T4PS50_9BACT|nr:hypothetical protein [Sediminibacterium ginsengisoli]SJZ94464.1 hypothetical protein SAMN04488132_106195 [Sediminibacterium ginsengisoli]
MKKLLLLAMLGATFQLATAQDFKKVQSAFLLNRIDEAKTEIDKIAADPKVNTKPDVLYWKAKVYAAIYKDPTLSAKYPKIKTEAIEAMDKYMTAEPSFAQVKEKGADPFFDLYSTSFGGGVKVFNEKKWDDALDYFSSAVKYIDAIIANKWTNANITFDTTALLYAGYSAQNANKADAAVKFYSRLADHKVSGEGYVDVYKYLLLHFIEKKDEANFNKYVALSKEAYPKENWGDYEIEYIDKNYDLAQKTAMYEKGDAAGTLTEANYLQFGDLFSNIKAKEKDKHDSATLAMYGMKAAGAFKKAYAKNDKNAIAAFNVGVMYYNQFGDLDDRYASNIRAMQVLNSNKPVEKDPKKKVAADAKFNEQLAPIKKANADLEQPMNESLDQAIEWLTKSFEILKAKGNLSGTEKSVANKTVDWLANLYAYKRDKARGKDAKVFDANDAKFKEFDALHGKF